MNQKLGTLSPRKVGPAVPPKPKKPQPQVPKSYQLSGGCEPSYSSPLQTAAPVPEIKRSAINSAPVYSNILPINDTSNNLYSNVEQTMPTQHLYSNLEPYSKTHIIEDADAFKTWLASKVKSMIEADPVALAKYIYALVKKNKPLDELREKAISQLEVFFKEKTVSFVDMLFQAIATKSYITSTSITTTTTAATTSTNVTRSAITPPPVSQVQHSDKMKIDTSSHVKEITNNKNVSDKTSVDRTSLNKTSSDKNSGDKTNKSETNLLEKSEVITAPQKKRRRSVSPQCRYRWSKSRSRSISRSRYSRSRSRSRSGSWERRNKYRRSPFRRSSNSYRKRRYSNDRMYYSNRRRSWSRSYSRSPIKSRSRSRSRSKSFSPRKLKYRHRNPSPLSPLPKKSGFRRSESEIYSENKVKIASSIDYVEKAVSGAQVEMKYVKEKKDRCIDFEEKGFCMRGDMCPFDHGVNPVVLEPCSVPLLPIQQAPQPRLPLSNPKPYLTYQSQGAQSTDSVSHLSLSNINEDLYDWISLKTRDDSTLKSSNDSAIEEGKPRAHVFTRLGPRPVKETADNCTLVITNIPPKCNTITQLFNHFSKFGNVVNIKVNHNNDPSAAMLTYSKSHEAIAALRSSDPVMRNRFIKVAWCDGSCEREENVPPTNVAQTVSVNSAKVTSKPFEKPAAVKSLSFPTKVSNVFEKKKKVTKAALIKKKKIEAKQITSNLMKLKQELLEEQIEKQKLLIEKLEKGQYKSENKNSILSTIKMLDTNIKEIKNSLTNSVNKLQAANATTNLNNLSPGEKKIKLTEVKRDLLDAELDLFTLQQKGSDSSQVEEKILSLKKQVTLLEGSNPPVAAPWRPISVLPKVSSLTIDHRPMKLLVQDYNLENKASIISHMMKFGELEIEQNSELPPSLILRFKTHKEADLALNKSKLFFGDKINISFCN